MTARLYDHLDIIPLRRLYSRCKFLSPTRYRHRLALNAPNVLLTGSFVSLFFSLCSCVHLSVHCHPDQLYEGHRLLQFFHHTVHPSLYTRKNWPHALTQYDSHMYTVYVFFFLLWLLLLMLWAAADLDKFSPLNYDAWVTPILIPRHV